MQHATVQCLLCKCTQQLNNAPTLSKKKKMPFTIAHSALLEQGVNNWLQHQDRDT
jgi:hypothetical protein